MIPGSAARGARPRPARRRAWHASVMAAALLFLGVAPARLHAQSQASLEELPPGLRQALSGVANPNPTPVPEAAVAGAALGDGPIDPASYRLGPGDELMLHYRGRTSLTQRLVVNPEGQVYVPDVGPVSVAGRTLDEGRKVIRTAAGRVVNRISIDIELVTVRSFKVSVTGEVRQPGIYPATGATRLYELIRRAGGLTDSAAARDIRLVDQKSGLTTSIDLLPFLLRGEARGSNPYVGDGSTLLVPRRSRWVDVEGAVLHPGRYDLPPTVTRVGDLLRDVGLQPEAAIDRLELATFDAAPPEGATAPVVLRGTLDELGGRALAHGDRLFIAGQSGYRQVDAVEVEGEVRYPGRYVLEADTLRLAALLERAGGVTADGLVARVLLARSVPGDTLGLDVDRLARWPAVAPTTTEREYLRRRGWQGRRAAVIDLSLPGGGGPFLRNGDRVVVPRRGGYVEVAGRVRNPGFYPHVAGADAGHYIAAAGGFVSRADGKQVRLGVGPGDNFRRAADAGPPEPGDLVWVPEKSPRPTFEVARDVVLVLGQLATLVLVVDQINK